MNKKINLSFSELNLLYKESKKYDIYQKDSGNSDNFISINQQSQERLFERISDEGNPNEIESLNNKGFLESLEFNQNIQGDFSKLKEIKVINKTLIKF